MTLGYNGSGQLTSITDPAPGAPATTPVTTFGYASTTVDRITRLQDPDSNTTTFSYSSAGRVQSLQRPDLVNESLTALQVQGLSTATLAVEDQATIHGRPGQDLEELARLARLWATHSGAGPAEQHGGRLPRQQRPAVVERGSTW